MPRFGDPAALAALREAGALWRAERQFLNAGIAMSKAVNAAWGAGDEVELCLQQAIEDYRHCIADTASAPAEGLAALTKLARELGMWYRGGTDTVTLIRTIEAEIVQRTRSYAQEYNWPTGCLVYGVAVASDMVGGWQFRYPGQPVLDDLVGGDTSLSISVGSGVEGMTGDVTWIGIPSAFGLLMRAADYIAAYDVCKECPDAFRSVSLAGWPPALQGFLRLREPSDAFDEASRLFATDTAPNDLGELARRGGSWNGENLLLWSKYFAALSHLTRAAGQPSEARRLIALASQALEGTDSGLVSPQVSRLRVIVRALAGLLGVSPGMALIDARRALVRIGNIHGHEHADVLIASFLDSAESAFERLGAEPEKAIVVNDLGSVIVALERLPPVGDALAKAVSPALGEAAVAAILGPQRTKIHRLLGNIRDEGLFRQLFLRLLQSGLPRYAQVRHGPIEYGKDLAVVLVEDGQSVLRMYQLKTGDISMPVWRVSIAELEQMFLAPIPPTQTGPVDRVEGVLLCTGHANTYVEPLIGPWIEEQARAYGRHFQFMHLDNMVDWIMTHRLLNECVAALHELGIVTV